MTLHLISGGGRISPLVNLSERSRMPFSISTSPLKACPFMTGIVCVSTAMVVVDVSDVDEEPCLEPPVH